MGIAYKNFWSLNTDEAVVKGILKHRLKNDVGIYLISIVDRHKMKDIRLTDNYKMRQL